MKEIIRSIITNVLTAFYQPFWFAVLLSVLFMFLYLYARSSACEGGHGFKEALKTWLRHFRRDPEFRRLFFFVFYLTMILFRTLVNRNMWLNPLSDVMGGWWIYKEDSKTGEMVLTTECIENLILFARGIQLIGVRLKNKPDGLFFTRQFVPERHKLL